MLSENSLRIDKGFVFRTLGILSVLLCRARDLLEAAFKVSHTHRQA